MSVRTRCAASLSPIWFTQLARNGSVTMTLWLSTSSLSCFPHWISAWVLIADDGVGKHAVRKDTINRALTNRRMDVFLLRMFTYVHVQLALGRGEFYALNRRTRAP